MKHYQPKLLLFILLIYICPAFQAVQLSKDVVPLENLWKEGKLDELVSQIFSTKAQTDEDRAFLSFLNSQLKTQRNEFSTLIQQTIDRFPNTFYGQLSMLEKAKMHILERDYASARKLLTSINHTELVERFHWLASCALALEETDNCISNCETYLRLAPNGKLAEETIYLMAEAQKKQGKFQSALSTLGKLNTMTGHPKNPQYLYYQLGLVYSKQGNVPEALLNLKKGFELNRNSQLAFLIEDSLFELKDRYKDKVDLSFLYPYEADETTPSFSVVTPPTVPPSFDSSKPLKLDTKPLSGIFLQAGRFANMANAEKLCSTIRNLNLNSNYFEDKANKATPWVVISGPYNTKDEANRNRQTLLANDIECFVTSY